MRWRRDINSVRAFAEFFSELNDRYNLRDWHWMLISVGLFVAALLGCAFLVWLGG